MLNLRELVSNINKPMTSVVKREVIKVILTSLLLKKNKSKKFWIRIWNNYEAESMVDLYFEDLKENEVIVFKIVEAASDKQREKIISKLNEIRTGLIDNKKIRLIEMKKVSEDIVEMRKYLEKII